MITKFLNILLAQKNLSQREAKMLLDLLTKEESNSRIAAILTALACKGETVEEMSGFIEGMREKKLAVIVPKNAVDVCGTGGDNSNTFNISTAVSFVVAGAGVPVVKHGNRAATSRCGSADVLEALGITIQLTPRQAEKVLQKTGMVFLFAPLFHPSFKKVGAVRKELGIRTIFNYLGPFVNPAGVTRQIIGVPSKEIAEKLAEVATKLSYDRLCIVTSEDKLDEVSIFYPTTVFEVTGRTIKTYTIDPVKFGFNLGSKNDLIGGDAKENAQIIMYILQGEKGPRRDIVVLNSAVALYVAGKVKTIVEGINLSEESIDSKKALHVLENFRKETQKYA